MIKRGPFEGAEKKRPTKAHRPAVWEVMVGTVRSMSPAGEAKYWDYDWEKAREWAGVTRAGDLRVWPVTAEQCRRWPQAELRPGRLVLWVR